MRSLIFLAMLGFIAGGGKTEAAMPKLAHVDDLKDKRIGALQGSAHVDYVEKTWPRATLLQYSSPADLLLAVKTGKVDAALSDAEPLREMLREDKTLGVLGDNLFSFPEGVGFRKENTALLEQFNQFLAKLKQSGIHADMVDRWMERNVTDMPVIANPGRAASSWWASATARLPFVAIKDNKLIGFEIELAERFAAHLGRKVRFSQIDFSGLIAAVATGKVDMIVAAIFITDERKQSINFSDPYYEEATKVFGLKKNIAAYDTADTGSGLPFLTRVAASFHSNIIQEKRYLLLWDGLKATVLISIFATILGTLLGALVCYMRMAKRRVLNVPARVYISIMRGMPVLVLLMLIFYVAFASVNIDPLVVAIIAFGLNFAAYAAEIFRSGVEGIDRGQTEAGIAMGFSRAQHLLPHRAAADRAADPAGLPGRVHLARQDDLDRGLHRRAGPDEGERHHPQPHLRRLLPAGPGGRALFPDRLGAHAGAGVRRAGHGSAAQAGAGGARMIKVEHLSKRYGDLCVLKDVTAEIRKGEVVSIIGPSGAGKSTFLRCLNLLEHPSGGSIHVDGVDILDRKADIAKVRQKMNMVFQSFNLFAHLSALENLTIGPIKLKGMDRQAAQAKALDLLQAGRPRGEGRPLPGRAVRRPAAAGGHRALPRDGPGDHPLRRADFGARSHHGERGPVGHAAARQGRHDDGGRHA